jgi:hypothetical protein
LRKIRKKKKKRRMKITKRERIETKVKKRANNKVDYFDD